MTLLSAAVTDTEQYTVLLCMAACGGVCLNLCYRYPFILVSEYLCHIR